MLQRLLERLPEVEGRPAAAGSGPASARLRLHHLSTALAQLQHLRQPTHRLSHSGTHSLCAHAAGPPPAWLLASEDGGQVRRPR
jgi:hypothetical protein